MIDKKKLLKQQRIKRKKDEYEANRSNWIEKYGENNTDMIRLAHKNTHPQEIYYAHKELAIKIRNEAHTQPNSRMLLGEEYRNDKIEVMAWVSDIRDFWKNGKKITRILLDRPQIIRKYGTNQKPRMYDSHTWIDIKDIESCYGNTLYMSIGDLVLFDAAVYEYHGRIEHEQFGFKYGFNQIKNLCSGYPFFKRNAESGTAQLTDLKYDYPRHQEWILRWVDPENYQTQPIPEYLRNNDKYTGWAIKSYKTK